MIANEHHVTGNEKSADNNNETFRNVSTCLRHLLFEISVGWTRFARSFLLMWGSAPTPPGFSEA